MSLPEHLDDVREVGETAPPMIHLYRTGGREPVQGDVALCGWVKKLPQPQGRIPPTSCVVCIELDGKGI